MIYTYGEQNPNAAGLIPLDRLEKTSRPPVIELANER
jgi:hypothetical protein